MDRVLVTELLRTIESRVKRAEHAGRLASLVATFGEFTLHVDSEGWAQLEMVDDVCVECLRDQLRQHGFSTAEVTEPQQTTRQREQCTCHASA